MACSHGCCESNRAHWLSVSISPAATPTRTNAEYRRITRTESAWERDHPAYRRLRRDGLQPARIDGSADMEAKANSATEIEVGRLMGPTERDVFDDVGAAMKDTA